MAPQQRQSSRRQSRRSSAGLLAVCGLIAGGLPYVAPSFVLPGAQDAAALTRRRHVAAVAGVLLGASSSYWTGGGPEAAQAWGRFQSKEFLESKASEEGVVKLPSGLMYKVLETGPANGPSPKFNT